MACRQAWSVSRLGIADCLEMLTPRYRDDHLDAKGLLTVAGPLITAGATDPSTEAIVTVC